MQLQVQVVFLFEVLLEICALKHRNFDKFCFTQFPLQKKYGALPVTQSCPTLCDPMDYTAQGILQTRILEWVAIPFSRGSSQPRDWTQFSRIASGFFTSWATREAQEYWSGQPNPSPVDLPNPGIEPGSPALQADTLPSELSGKPRKPNMHL